jgi:uncharacterized membrane protein YphA (DoxX/SURF4 family)
VVVLVRFMPRLTELWALAVRLSTGFFWLYFASQRWFNVGWVRDLFTTAAANNYIPLYGDFLRSLAGDWFILAAVVTAAETAIGFMMVLGVFPRVAGGLGALIAANLLLTFSFCNCPWNTADAPTGLLVLLLRNTPKPSRPTRTTQPTHTETKSATPTHLKPIQTHRMWW